MALTREQLIAAGGREWTKDGMTRVYFNDLPTWYGLEVTRYKTGNISSASLDGSPLANGKATKLLGVLGYGKVWYDINDNTFKSKDLPEDIRSKIVARITAAATERAGA